MDVAGCVKQRSAIRSGIVALQGLEELSSIQGECYIRSVVADGAWDYNSGWKDHRQLRYLSIYNTVIDSNLARDIVSLDFLKCLVLIRPNVMDDTIVGFFQAVKAKSSLRVMLVGPMPSIVINGIKEAVTAAQPKCEIVYIEAPAEEYVPFRHVQLWVRQQLERGMMFEAKGTIIWPFTKKKVMRLGNKERTLETSL